MVNQLVVPLKLIYECSMLAYHYALMLSIEINVEAGYRGGT